MNNKWLKIALLGGLIFVVLKKVQARSSVMTSPGAIYQQAFSRRMLELVGQGIPTPQATAMASAYAASLIRR